MVVFGNFDLLDVEWSVGCWNLEEIGARGIHIFFNERKTSYIFHLRGN